MSELTDAAPAYLPPYPKFGCAFWSEGTLNTASSDPPIIFSSASYWSPSARIASGLAERPARSRASSERSAVTSRLSAVVSYASARERSRVTASIEPTRSGTTRGSMSFPT